MQSYFSLTQQPQRQNTCPWSRLHGDGFQAFPGRSGPVGTQVPCFRGIPFTYDPCCPLQYFKFSVHNSEHVNAMHIVVPLYLSKERQPSLHMFRSGAIISRSLSDPWLFASVVVKVTDTKCPLSSILQALLPGKL